MAVDDWGQDDTSITAYFHTPSVVISEGQSPDLDATIGFTCRGSGYVLAWIDKQSASFVKFRPLAAGSFVSTPQWIGNKHAVVNIRNEGDDKCFVWSIFAHLYHAKHKAERVTNYIKYEHTLNVTDLTFPLPVKQIPKLESMNPSIAVYCLACDRDSRSFLILYLSLEVHKREHTITLLLLDDPRDAQRHHYVWVKNLSALIPHRDQDHRKRHVCLSCLLVFGSKRVLNDHSHCCLIHKPQQTKFPDPNHAKSCKLSFRSHQFEFRLVFLRGGLRKFFETGRRRASAKRQLTSTNRRGFAFIASAGFQIIKPHLTRIPEPTLSTRFTTTYFAKHAPSATFYHVTFR